MTRESKPRVDARELVARLSQQSQALLRREIIAPLLPGGRIRTRLEGIVYEFRPESNFVGWGRFRPRNERSAEVLGEAQPWKRGGYLELFPVLRMILLWPDPHRRQPGTWWAIPFNESDARQRFGFRSEPLPVFLCDPTNGAERFERVLVRVDGQRLWFDGPDALADPQHADWLREAAVKEDDDETLLPGLAGSERHALLLWQIRQLEISAQADTRVATGSERPQTPPRGRQQQQAWLRAERQRNRLEERLRYALQKADATLHSYNEVAGTDGALSHIIVEWSERGTAHRYRSTVDPGLSVISSGICLSDLDSDFDLTSLVNVMTDAPW
ncbi:MAG: hypothetical protein J2P37_30945 [Ktedonobacteraceae bacterium]|nr:hypothetical protein [Ktedonobacteraceae bacterium]